MAYEPSDKLTSKAAGPEDARHLRQSSSDSELEYGSCTNPLLVPLASATPTNNSDSNSAASSAETSPAATRDSDGAEYFDKPASDELPSGVSAEISTPEDARVHDAGLEQHPPPSSVLGPECCEEDEDEDDFWIPRGTQTGAGAGIKKPPPRPH
ncbi:hypothetical protein C8Q73DRAFT_788554 [Cubamyces lactineus]|nr:hypothetical protein C8Q73DRAFT_788554 [Cubamyces lactineus]